MMKKLLLTAVLVTACGGEVIPDESRGLPPAVPLVHTSRGDIHILPLWSESTVELVYRGPIPAADIETGGGEIAEGEVSYSEYWEPEWGGAHFIVYRPDRSSAHAIFSPKRDGTPYIPWEIRILGNDGRLDWRYYCGEGVAVCVGPL
jgi:hypothetical protein